MVEATGHRAAEAVQGSRKVLARFLGADEQEERSFVFKGFRRRELAGCQHHGVDIRATAERLDAVRRVRGDGDHPIRTRQGDGHQHRVECSIQGFHGLRCNAPDEIVNRHHGRYVVQRQGQMVARREEHVHGVLPRPARERDIRVEETGQASSRPGAADAGYVRWFGQVAIEVDEEFVVAADAAENLPGIDTDAGERVPKWPAVDGDPHRQDGVYAVDPAVAGLAPASDR